MLTAGPLDIYGKFIDALTYEQDDAPKFTPYTPRRRFLHLLVRLAAGDRHRHRAAAGRRAEQLRAHPRAENRHPGGGHEVRHRHPQHGRAGRAHAAGRATRHGRRASRSCCSSAARISARSRRSRPSSPGPGGLKENAINFPVSLLNLLPNNVDADVTKLTVIARPSLYELLPFDDPRWECVAADGSRHRVAADDLLTVGPWEPYWPSAGTREAALHRRLAEEARGGGPQAHRRRRTGPIARTRCWASCRRCSRRRANGA